MADDQSLLGTEQMFDQAEIEKGTEHPVLGPNYFRSRDVVEKFMVGMDADQFAPILKKAADDFYSQLLDSTQNYLLSNAEHNLQVELWRGADNIVQALLSGEKWAVDKYVLGERYDCEKVRAEVAKHIPKELQDARIADLESQVEKLRKDVAFYRSR